MDAPDAITKKIGPLPAWAWAASVVVLVLLFRHFHNAGQAPPVDPAQTDLTDPANDPTLDPAASGAGDPFAGGGFTGSGGAGFPAGSTTTLPDGTTVPTDATDTLGGILDAVSQQDQTLTDISTALSGISDSLSAPDGTTVTAPKHTNKAQWGAGAADYVIGRGGSPATVDTAIWRYLHGKPLSAEQRKIVNQAIRHQGQPPGGVLPIHNLPNPHPAKPLGHTKDTHHSQAKNKTVPKHPAPRATVTQRARAAVAKAAPKAPARHVSKPRARR